METRKILPPFKNEAVGVLVGKVCSFMEGVGARVLRKAFSVSTQTLKE